MDHSEPITGYVINYARVGSSKTTSVNISSGTTHTISELVASIDYLVTMAAVNINETGLFSNPVVGTSGDKGEFMLSIWVCRLYKYIRV